MSIRHSISTRCARSNRIQPFPLNWILDIDASLWLFKQRLIKQPFRMCFFINFYKMFTIWLFKYKTLSSVLIAKNEIILLSTCHYSILFPFLYSSQFLFKHCLCFVCEGKHHKLYNSQTPQRFLFNLYIKLHSQLLLNMQTNFLTLL